MGYNMRKLNIISSYKPYDLHDIELSPPKAKSKQFKFIFSDIFNRFKGRGNSKRRQEVRGLFFTDLIKKVASMSSDSSFQKAVSDLFPPTRSAYSKYEPQLLEKQKTSREWRILNLAILAFIGGTTEESIAIEVNELFDVKSWFEKWFENIK
jgi:hypothetical protein